MAAAKRMPLAYDSTRKMFDIYPADIRASRR